MSGTVTATTGFAHLTDLPCWHLRFGNACAVISSYGAQVLSYQPEPGKELLWLSPLASWNQQQPMRGGIPVCWPWFGAADSTVIPDACSQPSHGLVRTSVWQLHAIEQNDDVSSLTLQVTLDNLPHSALPVTLYLKLTLNSSLTVELRCDSSIPQQAALHSYFAVADSSQVEVQGLSQHYYDKVSGTSLQQEHDLACICAETDRVYQSPAAQMTISSDNDALLNHASQKHALQIEQSGQDHAVLWNPWLQKSKAMHDVPDDGYLNFVCVESARLHWQPLPLVLRQQISLVKPLS